MNNDPVKNTRTQLLGMKRPEHGIPMFLNPRKYRLDQEPITFKTGMLFELNDFKNIKTTGSSDVVTRSDAIAPQSILSCLANAIE